MFMKKWKIYWVNTGKSVEKNFVVPKKWFLPKFWNSKTLLFNTSTEKFSEILQLNGAP